MVGANAAISDSMFTQHCWLHGTSHRSVEDAEVAEGRLCSNIDNVSQPEKTFLQFTHFIDCVDLN